MTDRVKEKYRKVITYILLPAILAAYAFTGLREGVDVVDATFSLTGFTDPDRLDPFWHFAYYLSNQTGHLLTRLPGGDTLFGMNAYGSVIIAATALVAYFGVMCVRGTGTLTHSILTFTGVFLAESLCWCPRVILYNYLTYFFMTVGVVLLLCVLGAKSVPVPLTHFWLLLAGLSFGLNVHVRFPNIVQAVFILLVWYDAWRRKEAFSALAKKTAVCVAGYLIGFGVPFLAIAARYGVSSYAEMILALFGLTADAQDYSAGGMLTTILAAYGRSLVKMWPLWVAVVASIVMDAMLLKRRNVSRVIYGLLCLTAMLYMYKQGVFTRSYWYYDSVFEPAMAFVILGVALFMAKRVSGAAALIILITPLGSNNYTYPLINNLFLVAPLILLTAWKTLKTAVAAPSGDGGVRAKVSPPLAIATLCVSAVLLFQGVLFHARYAFNDGTDGTPRDTIITTIPRAQGMKTTKQNARALESLYETLAPYRAVEAEWIENGNEPWGVLMFGKAPGIPYLMEIEPAIFTSWPDLDSVSVLEFDQALRTVNGFPVIIIKKDPATGGPEITGETLGREKWQRLQDHMEEKLYVKYDDTKAAPYTEYYDIYISMAGSRTYFY